MKKDTSAAAKGKKEALYCRLSEYDLGGLPPGLKLDTLKDIYENVIRNEWCAVIEPSPEWPAPHRAIPQALNLIIENAGRDYKTAIDWFFVAMDVFCPDKKHLSIGLIPENKLTTFVNVFKAMVSTPTPPSN